MEEKFIKWFIKEIPLLTEKGIITAQVAHSLNEYYTNKLAELEKAEFTEPTTPPEPVPSRAATASSVPVPAPAKKSSKLSVSVILTVIAGILISTGIISLIAYNWAAIPRLAKAITAILLLAGTQAGGIFLLKTGRAESIKVRESYSIFWALLFGGIVAFVSQIFKFPGDNASFLLVWIISSIIITYLFKAHTNFFFSLLLFVIFIINSFNTKQALFIYPIFIAFYCLSRKTKEKSKLIPIFILAAFVFLFRLSELKLSADIHNLLFCFALSSIGFVCLRKKQPGCKYTGLGILCLITLIALFDKVHLFLSIKVNSRLPSSQIPELIIISLIILGLYFEGAVIPFCKKIKSKEVLGFEELLYLLPAVLSLSLIFSTQTDFAFTAKLTEPGKLFTSPYLLIVLFTTALYFLSAVKKSLCQWIFLGFLFLESLNISHSDSYASTLVYIFIVLLLFAAGCFLLQQQFKVTKEAFWCLILLRLITALFYYISAALTLHSDSTLYKISGLPLAMFGCYIPAAILSILLLTLFAKHSPRSFLRNLDIPLNLIFIAVIFAIANKCDCHKLSIVMEAGFIINLCAAIFFVFNMSFEYSPFVVLGFFYYFQSLLSNEELGSASGASIFLLFSLITLLVHLAARLNKMDIINTITAISSGLILFYETSIRHSLEGDLKDLNISFFQIASIIVLSLAAIYLLYLLIRRKIIFNPAIILLPAAVFLLTRIQDKYSILVTFPLLFIFCFYYFYLAYKNDSLKTANIITIYFGLMLMIRFFSSGYGLSIQGITLIAMGVLILVLNILMTKRREKND